MKKTKLYLPPECEVVNVRTEQQFLTNSQKASVETMIIDEEDLDW